MKPSVYVENDREADIINGKALTVVVRALHR